MVSISLLLSAVLALATSQVTAIPSPQTGGPPEAISIFYADCTTNDQSRIPANDTSIASTDSTCYSFAFNGINQAFVSSGFTGNDLFLEASI
jgi:hypothetical protein